MKLPVYQGLASNIRRMQFGIEGAKLPSLNFCRNAKIISIGADFQIFAPLGRTKYSYGRIWPLETANVQPIFSR